MQRDGARSPTAAHATRPVPLHLGIAEFGIDGRRYIADGAVRPDGVVVVFPDRQRLTSMSKRGEQSLVQQLVTQSAVKTLDEGVLRRLAWCDVVPANLGLL